MFAMMDVNKDGKITLAELQHGLEEIGMPCCPDTLKGLFGKHDANKNGTLDLAEFQALMGEMLAGNPKVAGMMKAFKEMDKDHNGTLDAKELAQAMGQVCTDMDPVEMFKKIDTDGDGKITIKEFMAFAIAQEKQCQCSCK